MNESSNQPLPPLQQPNGSNFGYAAGAFFGDAAATAGAVAGAKAGKNHYERTGDFSEAAWLGAIAGRRWMVWVIACGVWFVQILITFVIRMSAVADSREVRRGGDLALAGFQESLAMYHAWLWALPINLVLLLVLYKRNVDFSMFKRNVVYHLIAPVAGLLNWFPNWMLYAGLVVVPVTLQYVF